MQERVLSLELAPQAVTLGIGETSPLVFLSLGDLIFPGPVDCKIWLGHSSRGIMPKRWLGQLGIWLMLLSTNQLQSWHPSLPSCFSALSLPCQSPPCTTTSQCHSADSALGKCQCLCLGADAPEPGIFLLFSTLCPPQHCYAQSLTPPFLEIAPFTSGPHPPLWGCRLVQGSVDGWDVISLQAPSFSSIPNSPHTQTTHVNKQLKSLSLAGMQ